MSEIPVDPNIVQTQNEKPAWQEAQNPQDVIAAIRTENETAKGNVMIELSSQRTDDTYWLNPLRVSQELEHPEQYPDNNNGIKFGDDVADNELRITQVVPLAIDQNAPMPEEIKRQLAIKKFARDKGYQVSGAYEGHFVKRNR